MFSVCVSLYFRVPRCLTSRQTHRQHFNQLI